MKININITQCEYLLQAGPINSTTSMYGGLCAHKEQYCSNLIGSFCPKCDANGNFLPQQCSGSTGYCWCVNIITGKEIPNTKTPPGVIPVNCSEWFWSFCTYHTKYLDHPKMYKHLHQYKQKCA
uniref:Thyroglobulin type-1 domain-containing protein n=1 Tax=Amphilophus citrinellus TaxID=61819 RepID=A0A3Q0S6F0_AMPCI